jgi:hypothetical protein
MASFTSGEFYTGQVGNLPRVPYQEPDPWVPSGGFEQFRSPEERKRDAEEAARREAEVEQGADDELDAQS